MSDSGPRDSAAAGEPARAGASIRVCGVLLVMIAATAGAAAVYAWNRAYTLKRDAKAAAMERALAYFASQRTATAPPTSAPSSSPAHPEVQLLAFLAFDGRNVDLGGAGPPAKTLRPLIPLLSSQNSRAATAVIDDPTSAGRSLVAIRCQAGEPPADGVLVAAVHVTQHGSGLLARFAAVAVAILGLAVAFQWLRAAVLRPMESLTRALSPDEAPFAARDSAAPPPEFAELSRFVVETRADLRHWKNEARTLRQTLDDRVSQRTRSVERELRRKEREATTDTLSGLGNRRSLDDSLKELIDRSRENGGDLSAVLIDVNEFKTVNDKLGHEAGDRLIQVTGNLLRATVRPGRDAAFRLGGDEFVVLMTDTTPADAAAIAERNAALFAQTVREFDCNGRRPSLSAGVASLFTTGVTSGQELLKAADAAMYSAKRLRRNVVVAHTGARAGPGAKAPAGGSCHRPV